jgi:hypothetical protein
MVEYGPDDLTREPVLHMAYKRLPVGVFHTRFGQVAIVTGVAVDQVEVEWKDGERSLVHWKQFPKRYAEWDGR